MLRRLALVPLAALGLATAFLVAGAGGAVTSVVLVSVGPGGVEANAASFAPTLSGNGRFLAFASDATNLAGLDPVPARTDIFVRDLQTGVTERITSGNGNSSMPSISDDGRWVAFESAATDIAPPDTNGKGDVFLYDRDTDATVRITHGTGNSSGAAVSGDGNFVAFGAYASDLDPTTGHVYRWERSTSTVIRASVTSAGADADNQSTIPAISRDGSVIAFNSRATNLVAGDTNATWDVFVRDLDAGTTEAASVSSAEVLAEATFFGSGSVRISGNGRYVTFGSSATNLVPGFGSGVYLRDRTAGTTDYVSAGNGNTGGSAPAPVTDDGHVAFSSFAALVAEDTNFRTDVYVASTPERISVTDTGAQATSASSSDGASSPTMSGDGSLIVVQNRFASVIAGSTTLPNLVAYTLGSVGGGTTTTTTASTPTTTTLITTPATAVGGAPRLVVEPSFRPPADSAGFRPGETIAVTATVTNEGDAPANDVRVRIFAYAVRPSRPDDGTVIVAGGITVSGCRFVGSTTEICTFDRSLAPGESAKATFFLPPPTRAGDDRHYTGSGFQATSLETQSDIEAIGFPVGPAKQADCGPAASCPTSDGEDNRACIDTRCFFDTGDDRGVCAGEAAVCSGGEDEDNMICLRDATCSGGADDDSDICRSAATCTEDASDDTLNCAGLETFCNAGNGENTIVCKVGATCVDGSGDSEVECGNATVNLGRGDHEAEGRNCKWTMGSGDNVLDGTGTNRVTLKGPGTFARTGGGTVVVDANNGEKNVIDCNGGKSTVYVDEEDDPRDCETVIGADVWVRPGLSSYGDDRFQGLFYVGNSGPADATNVRVRAQITLTGAELRSYRAQAVTPNRNGLTSHVVDTPEGAQLVIECEFPVIRKGASELVQFIGTPTRRAEPAFISVEARADEPDHVPANNAASREQDAKTFVGGKP